MTQLYIENIAVIERASIDFQGGFNVLTGETGAGKSILIDSLHAVLGERTSRDLIRTGARSAFVSATFSDVEENVLEAIRELGYTAEEDGTLLLQREISAEGKSSCRINSRPATVSVLREIGAQLINIHGQHESYGLLSPESHMGYLDRMGVPQALLQAYQEAYRRMNRVKKELEGFQMDEAQKARQIDLLTYQIGELEEAQLRPGEQEELTERRDLYRNSEKIAGALQAAKLALDGEDEAEGALSAVTDAADALAGAGRYLPAAASLEERLRSVQYELEDCNTEIGSLADGLEYDPEELEQIEGRLDQLYRLGLKYGGSVEEMLAFLEDCKKQLSDIELSDAHIARLTKEHQEAETEAWRCAKALSAKRQEVAALFAKRVQEELTFLDMPNVTFLVQREEGALSPSGCDRVQFLISTNPGEPAKPLAKIASGGELSRIMLAIKTVLAGTDHIGTLIFDEIDTGISGSAAQKVGLKLREVSRTRQVICVTHLAQIASLADAHFQIKKHVEHDRTYTNVTALDHEGRKRELARIMGGTEITELLLQNAEEMLQMAKKTP